MATVKSIKAAKKSAARKAPKSRVGSNKLRKKNPWQNWMALAVVALVAVVGYAVVQYSQAARWVNGAWYGSIASSYNGVPYSGSGYGPGARAGQTITAKITTGDKILSQNGMQYTTNERICVFFKSEEDGARGMWNFLEGAGEVEVTQNNDPSSKISVSNGDFKAGGENTISGCMRAKDPEMEEYGSLGPVKRGNSFRLFALRANAATLGEPRFRKECVNKECQTVPDVAQSTTMNTEKTDGSTKSTTAKSTTSNSTTTKPSDPLPPTTTPTSNTSANPSQPTGESNEHTIRIKVIKGAIGQVFVYTGAW